jgi:hypothetical protein
MLRGVRAKPRRWASKASLRVPKPRQGLRRRSGQATTPASQGPSYRSGASHNFGDCRGSCFALGPYRRNRQNRRNQSWLKRQSSGSGGGELSRTPWSLVALPPSVGTQGTGDLIELTGQSSPNGTSHCLPITPAGFRRFCRFRRSVVKAQIEVPLGPPEPCQEHTSDLLRGKPVL